VKRLRFQLYYSVLGLDPNKGLDIVMDEKMKTFSVQTDNDCKKNKFEESLLPVQLFFQFFESLTDYKGMENGLHKFMMIEVGQKNDLTPEFYFFFDVNHQLVKVRLSHGKYGHYDFLALRPL